MATIPIRDVPGEPVEPSGSELILIDNGVEMQKATIDDAVTPKATEITDQKISDLDLGSASQADIEDFATAEQGNKADSAVQPDDLAPVATSGDYNDLANLPTLGTAAAADVGDFAPAAQAVPTGGSSGQVLAKASGDDNDVEWTDAGTGDMLRSEYDPSGLGMPISTFGDFPLFRLSARESAVTLNLSAFEDVIVDRWSSSSLFAPARYRKLGSQPSHDAWFQDGAGNFFSMEEKMPLVSSFGAIGDGSSDDTDAIERANGYSRTVFFPIGDYLITRPITVGTTSKWIGTVPQSTNNQPGNRIWIEARIADIGDGNPLIKLTDPDVSAQSFVFQNLGFRGDMDPGSFNDLSTVSEIGMVGVDISHAKNGLKFIDCYFRQLVCGAKQFDDDPYLDKTLFERCHFTRCYRGVSASPTGGLVFMNCEFDECVDFIDSTREVTLIGVRFNNSTFSTENCQVSGRNIKVVGGYAEGGNNIFNPSASVSVDAFYSSVMHSASGERFLVKPQGNNVTVRFENTRIHSSNRLINFASVGDVRTISMDVNNNYDGTGLFGNSEDIQFYIDQGLDYRGHGNLNSEAWNWSGPLRRGFNSSFTLGLADKEKLLVCTGGSGITVTIPDSASAPFAIGTKIAFANWTGAPITVAINGDTLTHPLGRGSRTVDGDGYAEIIKIAATAWTIHGSGIS